MYGKRVLVDLILFSKLQVVCYIYGLVLFFLRDCMMQNASIGVLKKKKQRSLLYIHYVSI